MASKRPDGRVEPGQRISSAFSARAWNRAQDAADVVLGARTGAMAGASSVTQRASNIVLVRNTSGQPVPWLGVLEFEGVQISPVGGTLDGTNADSARAREFVRQPVLTGVMPNGTRPFGVAIEPIPIDGFGRLAVGGVFACQVEIINTSHRHASPKAGTVTRLKSNTCGAVELLWKDTGVSGPEDANGKWAVGVM
jgi:hypothetical protein